MSEEQKEGGPCGWSREGPGQAVREEARSQIMQRLTFTARSWDFTLIAERGLLEGFESGSDRIGFICLNNQVLLLCSESTIRGESRGKRTSYEVTAVI